jgi:hypothetical protein
VEYSRYHFDLMEVDGDTLSWRTFDDHNQLIDMFTLKSRVPSLEWQQTVPSNGTLPLILSGKPGVSYVLESSSELRTWTAFATNTFTANGPSLKTNLVSTTDDRGFIRARVKP